MVERPMPVSSCTRYLVMPAATATRDAGVASRVTITRSISICSASSRVMPYTLHVLAETDKPIGDHR